MQNPLTEALLHDNMNTCTDVHVKHGKRRTDMIGLEQVTPAGQENTEPVVMPDDEVLYELADLFRVFGDSTRIKILYALHDNELCVQDIANAVQLSQCSAMRYDREGDDHYDLLSALHKSIRGPDPDAAVYYLGRLLVAGDLIAPCRRLLCIAAEDVGLAYPQAITVVKSCVDAALQLGLPEARLPLAEAAVLLATAPKSNSAHDAINAAMEDIRRGAVGDIPRHLKNVHADSAGAEKAAAYKYPHSYPDHYVKQRYLPESLGERTYYQYGENKTEQAAKRY